MRQINLIPKQHLVRLLLYVFALRPLFIFLDIFQMVHGGNPIADGIKALFARDVIHEDDGVCVVNVGFEHFALKRRTIDIP